MAEFKQLLSLNFPDLSRNLYRSICKWYLSGFNGDFLKYIFLKKEKKTSKNRQNKSIQKKKEDICGFRLFVLIMFKATSEPNKYEPLSPKNILAFGKLNSRKDSKTII